MGRASLFIVLALAVAFGYIGSSIRDASKNLIGAHAGYLDYTNARNIARLGVHRLLRFRDGQALKDEDRNYKVPMKPETVSFNGGEYMTDSTCSGDTLTINSVGSFGDTSFTVHSKFLQVARPIPAAAGAMGINTDLGTFTDPNHKLHIDGRNYDSTGTSLVGSGNMPGITVESADDSLTVKATGDSINGRC